MNAERYYKIYDKQFNELLLNNKKTVSAIQSLIAQNPIENAAIASAIVQIVFNCTVCMRPVTRED